MKKIAILLIIFSITACGGGSSSSTPATTTTTDTTTPTTPTTPTVTAFTTWSAVVVNDPTKLSSGVSATIGTDGVASLATTNASGTFTINSAGGFSEIAMNAGTTNSVSFKTASGDTIQNAYNNTTAVALNQAQTLVSIDAIPSAYSFQYQIYGAWGSYGSSSLASNAVSLGSPSTGAGIPTTGTTTVSCSSSGYFVDLAKNAFLTNATMSATINFAAGTITFSTANTGILGGPLGSPISNNNLDLSGGSITYTVGTNVLTGSVFSANNMVGPVNGLFYGPNANELGGTYAITNTLVGTMVGGFGCKL